jgi:amino acid transporter
VPLSKPFEDFEDLEHGVPDTGPLYGETPQEDYGGFDFTGAFFGWLVAIAMTVLLAGICGACATVAGQTLNLTQAQAEQQAGTIGLAGAVALLLILLVAYFVGGYVAGRMSRFDGGRQGVGVWLFGLLVTILLAVLGALFDTQYDVFQRAELPPGPIPTNILAAGGVVTLVILVAVVVGTLMCAIRGGRAGQRYHAEIDRAIR